jgi:hypothetical protein
MPFDKPIKNWNGSVTLNNVGYRKESFFFDAIFPKIPQWCEGIPSVLSPP